MKITNILIFLYFSCSCFAHANTYVWEDYDDFSGSNLDTSKWDFSCWDGGNLPVVSNGRALLAGKTNYSWNDTIATDRMRAVNQNAGSMLAGGEPHSVLEFRESDELYGIELELTLPNDILTDSGIGIYAIDYDEMFGGDEEQSIRFDLDLWYSGGTPEVQVTWKNPTTGAEGEANHIAVSKGVAVKLAFIRDDENIEFFCNDASVASAPYQNVGETFIVRTVNENGNAFSSYVDNVRVLRHANTTPLDGTVLTLSSADDVSETLSFENGTFTSTFQDPTEGTFVDTDKSYILDEVSSDVWKITLEDGDTYSFDASTNSGTLVDYENGQIDTEGTWSFTFERHDWEDYDDFSSGSLDSSKWEVAWFKGGRAPTVVNGALQLGGSGDPNDPASDSMPYQLSLLDIPESMATHPHAIITDSSVYGLEAEIMLPSGSQYSTGLNFLCWDTTSQTADGSFKQFGPEIEIWTEQSPTLECQYLDALTGERVDVALPANFDTYYKASLIQDGNKSMIFLDGKKVADFHYPEFSPNAYGFFAFNDDGHPFETYVKNVRVLRRSQESTELDPVTVVSDPNGQAVVVQVGDEYKWSGTLDGFTLWGVWEDSEGGWIGATIKYEGGMQKGSIGLTDQLGNNLEVNHPYIIDENGMIKVTEDTAFQYYQVTAVENDVIQTVDGSTFPLSDTSKFFTIRAAAEEYYYSKVNPKDWMWFDYYPWVYSNEEQDWLYFYPSGGRLMYWSNKGQAWRQFN